ncbi:GspMb/PilO family protein [Jannaschia pohangensis]|uniref:Type II secretion system (T2SS), protein M subtype b n=1 Tax=Jannaschia pohangensis TaxID=390807 RepID=A0A1I3JYS9_9RHOB|nr:GspMb/PilO family protein [Jannaschia pohangensis]SFI65429.1 Type II secretion system (T2SS), protein M subtype b [Jannaschia pohangensis]
MTRTRTLLLGLVIAFGVLVLLAVPLLRDWKTDIQSARDDAAFETARLQRSIADLETEAAQLVGTGILDTVWRARQPGEALAIVQTEIGDLATRAAVSLRSMSPIPAPDLPLVDTLGLRLEGEMPLNRLVTFLLALEHHDRSLIVRSANIRRLPNGQDRFEQPLLFVQLDVVAPLVLGEADG